MRVVFDRRNECNDFTVDLKFILIKFPRKLMLVHAKEYKRIFSENREFRHFLQRKDYILSLKNMEKYVQIFDY